VRGGCCGLILMFASAGIAKAAPPGAGPGQEVYSGDSCLLVGESFICMPLLVELDVEAVTTNAPVMGILGRYCSMEEMVAESMPLLEGLDVANGSRGVRLAAHVVYGMARPCCEARAIAA